MNVSWLPDHADDGAPTDPAFPRRRALLDPDVVGPSLAAALPGVGGSPELLNVYYYPGRALQAVWRVGPTVVTVEAYPADRPLSVGHGVPLPAEHWVAHVFPDDPGLPTLAGAAADLGAGAELFSYLPGRRAVLADPTRIIKVSTPDLVVAAHRRQLALWSAPDRRFRMPRPLSVHPERGVRIEERVTGVGVETRIGQVPPERLAALVAGELAALHACRLPVQLPRFGAPELLARVERKTPRLIRRSLAPLAPRAEHVVARLAATVPDPSGPPVTVHGDCHLANLLLDDAGLIFLDLDEIALAEPEQDLALFASRLLLVAVHRGEGLEEAASLVAALPDAYAAATGRPVTAAGFGWWLAASLVGRQLKTSVRHLAPGLGPLAATLLDLADDTLAKGRFDPDLVRAMAA